MQTVNKTDNAKERAATRSLLPLVAIGGGLAATPAGALELGELNVQSSLGQPLRASIAYALAPNEMLSDTCVSVSPGPSTSGLPGIGSNAIRITERAILISGTSAIREPMMATRVTINCPYTPNLSREYMLLVDPLGATTAPAVAEVPAEKAAPVPVAPVQSARPVQSERPVRSTRSVESAPIVPGTRYQVQQGDTLGKIAQSVTNRTMKLWPAVDLIFTMNPDAFIGNDPNKLKAGAWLTIPSLDGSSTPVLSTGTTATATTSAAPEPAATPYEAPVADAASEPVPAEPVAAGELTNSTTDLRPGDVIADSENPFVEPADSPASTVVIPDTELDGPQTTSTSPNVPTAVISTDSRSEPTSLLTWLIGGGLAVIVALLLFGRRVRNRFGSTPIAPVAAHPQRRASDRTEEIDVATGEAYDLADDSPTEENFALDADLVIGTGLDNASGMDVAEDIGFASPTEVDIELPFEPEPTVDTSAETETILDSEILPEHDDDYDMSVIVDATKMPQPEDVTQHDLKAVEVDQSGETTITDSYTIDQEIDYDILEQDYEDELTATQALNQEIARAAAELTEDLGEAGDEEATSEMPLASVTELDLTASLEQSDETVAMEQSRDPGETGAVTVSMTAEDKTAEMPAAGNDDTVDMEIEGGKVDTKAG